MSFIATNYQNHGPYNEHFFRRLRGGVSSWKSHTRQHSGAFKGANDVYFTQEMQRPYFYYENIVAHQSDWKENDIR